MYIINMRNEYEAAELAAFYDAIPQHEQLTCVEVGCYAGHSSVIAAARVKLLYCVDPWAHYVPAGESGPEDAFDIAVAPFKEKVIKIKATSADAVSQFEPMSVDMVYIDGMHDRYNVCHDILAWLPKIKEHGMICGHDYTDKPVHGGVVKAVTFLLGTPQIVMGEGSWRFAVDDIRKRIEKITLEEN